MYNDDDHKHLIRKQTLLIGHSVLVNIRLWLPQIMKEKIKPLVTIYNGKETLTYSFVPVWWKYTNDYHKWLKRETFQFNPTKGYD